MNLLGDTLEKIAAEKAGIIKARVPVVVSQYQSESGPLFNAVSKELKSTIEFADKVFKVMDYKIINGFLNTTILNKKTNLTVNLDLDLTGLYQLKNVLGVLNTIEFIKKAGFIVEENDVKTALKQVTKTTGLNGRWQTISEKPLIITDTGHNEDGIKNVISN